MPAAKLLETGWKSLQPVSSRFKLAPESLSTLNSLSSSLVGIEGYKLPSAQQNRKRSAHHCASCHVVVFAVTRCLYEQRKTALVCVLHIVLQWLSVVVCLCSILFPNQKAVVMPTTPLPYRTRRWPTVSPRNGNQGWTCLALTTSPFLRPLWHMTSPAAVQTWPLQREAWLSLATQMRLEGKEKGGGDIFLLCHTWGVCACTYVRVWMNLYTVWGCMVYIHTYMHGY